MKLGLPAFDYKKQLLAAKVWALRYQTEMISLVVLLLVSFAVLRVDHLTNPPLDQDRFDKQSQALKRVKFNDDAIKAIEALRDSNVNVNPNFPGDRENPFDE